MEYNIQIKKRFKYLRIYKISKRINDNTNIVSRAMQSLVDKYILKKTEE
jgi:hypothetical protein